jgi:hypothetical protein
MLTPWDDYPIHADADPIATPSSANPNHYDRYFFNGHERDGAFYIGGAMGHYPVLGVIDAAFSIVIDGVEHSVFASGRMPIDRATEIGPIRIDVVEPMRVLRFTVAPNDSPLVCDLTWRARTVVVEEPRQRNVTRDGIVTNEHTRLTQWGTWEGTVVVDGRQVDVDPTRVFGTRDRSWGMRGLSTPIPTNRANYGGGAFWLWAPLYFDDLCTHLALHEYPNGKRWVESTLFVPLLEGADAPTWGIGVDNSTEMVEFDYELDFYPGSRRIRSAVFHLVDPDGQKHQIDLETLYTFRMRGIGYTHPRFGHGSIHGELEVGHEAIALDDFPEPDPSTWHMQNVVVARMAGSGGDGRTGIGVLEQALIGPHAKTGLTGFLDPAPTRE